MLIERPEAAASVRKRLRKRIAKRETIPRITEMSLIRARLLLFEDTGTRRFAPLTHTRPVYELLCGLMSLRERCERVLGAQATLICRSHLARHVKETAGRRVNQLGAMSGGMFLFVNGRILDPAALPPLIEAAAEPGIWWNGGDLVAALLPATEARALLAKLRANDQILEPGMLPSLSRHLAAVPILEYPWQLALENGRRIERDVAALGLRERGDLPPGANRIGDAPLVLAPGAEVEPGAVIDTRGGPIVLGAGARVAGLTRLEGPAAVGAGSQLVGGRIRGGTTIGGGCRVAGEVEASIFHAYANKYHDGFIGHSYVGEWVNIGAMTTNSDLKNTYGTVRVWCDGKLMDTKQQKVGALIGDHAKTGIGSLLDTGTTIGAAANIYGGSAVLASKWIPSFAWGAPPKLTVHDPLRALETMKEVMRRRGVAMTPAYRAMIEEVFDRTRPERRFAGIAEE